MANTNIAHLVHTVAPDIPVIFSKTPTTVNGPFDDVPVDRGVTSQVDWEVELGVIIGTTGKNIRPENALAHVFGYTVINDISARDVQLLFADAATGARSPALVHQGKIGEIIQAKPEQRRRVLEDAAGVAGLHARRHEAELRLRAAETNLESQIIDRCCKERAQIGRCGVRYAKGNAWQQRIEQCCLARLQRMPFAAPEEGALRCWRIRRSGGVITSGGGT